MWAIATEKDVSFFNDKRALVSIYLSDGYDSDETQWILDSWCGFNEDAGHNWHLLIPCSTDAYVLNEKLDASHYDVKFANRVIKQHELAKSGLPLLMFENYDPSSPPQYVSFRGMSREKRRDILKVIAEIVADEAQNGPADANEFRKAILDRVSILVSRHKLAKAGLQTLAIGTAIIGVVSGLYSLR
ncbi:hypothetical protein LGH82_07905 [Mesorhizobium sp. PAMC28654]|uniref:hypothetical protein n=1 Tax=Mesorhizobium sp. PAMC28654 TaxID=2880934 RepID=UPI001D09DCC4|nr:hypothetical protein [Mesorhizobium sp. PAMC28654]UDL91180.1 hypothetical protein LGH82_07905 [Mesorhizobium sp. PAMC28654]